MDIFELEEAAQSILEMLEKGQFAQLAAAYGYALAFDQNPAIALKVDLLKAMEESGVDSLTESEKSISLKKFGSGQFKCLAECSFISGQSSVLIEVMLNSSDECYIEQISGFA